MSVMKPLLASQQFQAQIREQEWKQKAESERLQLEAERKALQDAQKEFAFKQKLFAHEEARLSTDKLKLEEKQREIETMTAVYLKEQSDLEKKLQQMSRLRDQASNLFVSGVC